MSTHLHIHTLRLAAVAKGDLRTILARLVSARIDLRNRSIAEYARASMAEGLAGVSQGTYTGRSRADRGWREDAMEEIPLERWASQKDFDEFFSNQVIGFQAAVLAGIKKGMRKAPHWFGYGSQGGTEEDILNSLNTGITLAQQDLASGGNIYRRTGLTHKGNNSLRVGGLMGNLKGNAERAVTSLIKSRNPDVRGDQEVGEDSPTIFDMMEDPSRSRDFTTILRDATPDLKRRLNDSQFRLWNVVLADPDIMSNDARGISTTQAERIHNQLYGESPSGSYLGKLWKRMLPTVLDELEDALVGWAMATRRRASASRVASRYLEACGDEPCAACDSCGCGGQCDGRCQNKEASSMDLDSLVLDNDNILSSLESQIDALEAVL